VWLTEKKLFLCRTIGSFSMTPFFLGGYNLSILRVWPNHYPTLCRRSLLWISQLDSAIFRPGIQGTFTSHLLSAFFKMFSKHSLRTSSCKRSPNLLLLPRANCTTDRNQTFHWATGIRVMITAENDHSKVHPINYRLHSLPFKQHLQS